MSLDVRIKGRKLLVEVFSDVLKEAGLIEKYFCRKCNHFHKEGSKIFEEHWKFQGMKVLGKRKQ